MACMCSESRRNINIIDCNGHPLKQVGEFKYLGVTVSEKGGSEAAVKSKMSAVRAKWKEYTVIIYDKRMARKLKVKVYSHPSCTVVWM